MILKTAARQALRLQQTSDGGTSLEHTVCSPDSEPSRSSTAPNDQVYASQDDPELRQFSGWPMEQCTGAMQENDQILSGNVMLGFDEAGVPHPDHSDQPAEPGNTEGESHHLEWKFPARPLTLVEDEEHRGKDRGLFYKSITGKNSDSNGRLPATAVEKDVIDVSPWTGSHVEDILSDQTIKHGYSVKSSLVTETNTARPTVWPHLKSKSGLGNLSKLFDSLLQERHADGQVASVSMFKPPPRVTLTDQKREAWLKDLANPSIPLRKQSRTIPHGVRGKPLLEQCVIKQISMSRAIWLAKCVGANELRAFRRKGVSAAAIQENELKWVENWTILVESFIDEHIQFTDRANWKKNLIYVLHLSSRFFAEGLLDVEHYLEWILRKLASSKTDELPISLLLAQTHLSTFASSAKLGQSLARICLLRLHELSLVTDKGLLADLHIRLVEFAHMLLICSSDCFVLSDIWASVHPTFAALRTTAWSNARLDRGVPSMISMLKEKVTRRNNILSGLTAKPAHMVQPPTLTVVQLLDAAKPSVAVESLSDACRQVIPDINEIVMVLLKWASSVHRLGMHRKYLACRLILFWNSHDRVDVGNCVIVALDKLRGCDSICPDSLARVVAELVRAGQFNVAHYLRSLLSAGGLKNGDSADSRILVHLPMQNLPSGLCSLRTMMLRNLGRTETSAAVSLVAALKRSIAHFMSHVLRSAGTTHEAGLHSLSCDHLAAHDIFEISDWLRRGLSSSLADPSPHPGSLLNASQVEHVLVLLEVVDDYLQLYNVIPLLSVRSDMDGLNLLALLFEVRFEAFGALGVSARVWQSLLKRYRSLRNAHAPNKDVCQALLRTADCTENQLPAEQYLKQELIFCEANQSVAACTPMSDGQFEAAQEFGGDLDRLLASGSIMEAPQLSAAINLLLLRADRSYEAKEAPLTAVKSTLVTLKIANDATFHTSLVSWFQKKLPILDDMSLADSMALLLGTECLSVGDFIRLIDDLDNSELPAQHDELVSGAVVFALRFFFSDEESRQEASQASRIESNTYSACFDLPRKDVWTKELWRREICNDHAQSFMGWIARCLCLQHDSPQYMRMLSTITSPLFLDALRHIMLQFEDLCQTAFGEIISAPATISQSMQALVAGIAQPPYPPQVFRVSGSDKNAILRTPDMEAEAIREIFIKTDEISLPFQQLAFMFATHSWDRSDDHVARTARVCLDCVKEAPSEGGWFWRQLIAKADLSVCTSIRLQAEHALLFFPSRTDAFVEALENSVTMSPVLCSEIVEATRMSIPAEGEASSARSILHHLNFVVVALDSAPLAHMDAIFEWLCAVLKVALLQHRSCCNPGTIGHVSLAILRIISNEAVQSRAMVDELAFDAGLYFAAHLNQSHVHLIRSRLGSRANSARIRFLLGTPTEQDSIFHLASSAKSPFSFSANTPSTSAALHSTSPYPLRKWELLPDATPNVGANDTALSLRLFGARKGK